MATIDKSSFCGKCPCCRNGPTHIRLHTTKRAMLPCTSADWVCESTYVTEAGTICNNRVKCIADFILMRRWDGNAFAITESKKIVDETKAQHFLLKDDNTKELRCTNDLSYKLLVNELQNDSTAKLEQDRQTALSYDEHMLQQQNTSRKFDPRRNVELLWGQNVDVTEDEQHRRARCKRMLFLQEYCAKTGVPASKQKARSEPPETDSRLLPYAEFHTLNTVDDMAFFVKAGDNAVFDYNAVNEMNKTR